MKVPYVKPQLNENAFNCPHCGAYTGMSWGPGYASISTWKALNGIMIAICYRCDQISIWNGTVMIFPAVISIDDPNEDLTNDIKLDYKEAGEILNKSPRGAAALLRLAIEKLMNYLKAEGKDLNEKIQWLVDNRGLNVQIQKSLDILRVIGNNAVHPGELNLKDTPEIANALFKLVNLIAEKTITEPKEIDTLFNNLPENAKKGITIREDKSKKGNDQK